MGPTAGQAYTNNWNKLKGRAGRVAVFVLLDARRGVARRSVEWTAGERQVGRPRVQGTIPTAPCRYSSSHLALSPLCVALDAALRMRLAGGHLVGTWWPPELIALCEHLLSLSRGSVGCLKMGEIGWTRTHVLISGRRRRWALG